MANSKSDKKLFVLAEEGFGDEFSALLAKGANMNAVREEDGYTCYHIAIDEGSVQVIDVLIKNGADMEKRTIAGGFTPALLAASAGNLYILGQLLDGGADMHAVAADGRGLDKLLSESDKEKLLDGGWVTNEDIKKQLNELLAGPHEAASMSPRM